MFGHGNSTKEVSQSKGHPPLNNSQADRALATLKRLADRLPKDRQVQDWYRFYTGEYDFKPGEFAAGTKVAAQR